MSVAILGDGHKFHESFDFEGLDACMRRTGVIGVLLKVLKNLYKGVLVFCD